ncbi:hypothetical protein E3Q23_03424 [Wallemia mellicola]|uniref:Hydrophobin n=1 Tax=Wallemia mellicola TaxID=1708541 RepID=A0A4T0N067_9BASI|nr:hypothetical protein E3Q23_03424 [Wallemia mellicola]TIB89730.1 hypothetical protein E3Q19_02955 [Wallemia mellicola]TIC27999.1 hypothetical protein E3Q10_03456 [Wallemia mellicola]TIC63409.1 hypothetical protein E3Q01_03386 [Wallemia mellicola]
MKYFTLSAALLSAVTCVTAGGPVVCTHNVGGATCVDHQVTKDCCAAVDHSARYDEVFSQCIPWAINGLNTGDMAECCESRGDSSRAEDVGAEHVRLKDVEYVLYM